MSILLGKNLLKNKILEKQFSFVKEKQNIIISIILPKYLIKKSSKYSKIHIELECAEGNAQTVLNCADDFYKDEVKRREYMYFEPYLVFDCDDPNNIQEVILK